MNRLPIALLACTFALFACQDDLTAPDLETADTVLAKKGGKPGGGEPTPPGLIYADLSGDRVEMDADGKVLRTLSPSVQGSPSHDTHSGTRWFVYVDGVPGVYPDSTQRKELFAVSEAGTVVQLTSDPLFEPGGPRWSPAPADGQIAFPGRRFSSPSAAADEGGIYVADVSFGAGVPAITTAANLRIPGVVHEDTTRCTMEGVCYANSDVSGPEWSPDGLRLAFTVYDQPQPTPFSLYVLELDGSRTLVTTRASGPRWSSQDLILFRRGLIERTMVTRLMSIAPDGSNETELVKLRDKSGPNFIAKRLRGHDWSPDGNHFVYAWRACSFPQTTPHPITCDYELVRRKADGSGEKLLAAPEWVTVQGWR